MRREHARPGLRPPALRWRSALEGGLLACLLLLAGGGIRAEEGTYADDAKCAECHEDTAKSIAGTPHGKQAFRGLSTHGCQTCHGPAAAHAEDPGNAETIPSVRKLEVTELAGRCQQCHAGGDHFFWKGGVHASRGVGCADCHGIHSFKSLQGQLKTEREIDTCFTCHADKRADAMRSSHHPLREGKMDCSDCHTPHGTSDGGNLSAESVNEKCYECHMEKRGPFLWEHAPVRENCLNCHTPHGSNHAKLQKTSVPYLCQQCHSNTRHPGTLYDATTLPGQARQTNRLFERACVNCHAAIHGSNHPSGPYLGR